MKHLQISLLDELHKRFKIVCVQEGKDMSEVARKIIEEYIEKAEKKLKK